ncbi:MAG TPA: AMP-binding protein [Methylomirabilota bacterium]|jgi:long-chain acyl-CoA synthetase|nr:AMP-binding protein [Methylomirabilota bacterium]
MALTTEPRPSPRPEAAAAATVHGQDTLPRLFRHVVRERGDRVAMREKDLGIWRGISWREYGQRARRVGMGLVALGLRPRDVVSIISDNRPEWLYTDLGVMSVAAIPNGIYTTDSARQVEYIVNDSGTRFLFVENEEQLDKILAVRDRCGELVKIFVYDMDGLHAFRDEQVMPFEALLELGERYDREHPDAFDRLVDVPRPDDLAILVYTSGTTGPPKGAMLSHRNILFQLAYADFITDLHEGDQQLSFLPLCHIAERTFTVFNPLHTGSTVNFAESIDTVPENIREVAPALFFAVPRIWEKFYSGVALRMRDATRLGRFAYERAIGIGLRIAERRIAGRPVPWPLRAAFRVADFLVLDNVKRSIGLHRARGAATGAAPIAPELIRWYLALGINMIEVYGQTENTGLATAMPPDRTKLGSVGIARPGTEVRLSPEGEILLRGPHVFLGYYRKPEKTADTVVDGWLHTGDVGTIDADGFVHITDRMKDIIITAGGKNVTPSEIENQLKFSPYIADAVVIGDRRKFLACLVMIDHETVAQFAQERNVPFSNFASLCRAPEVQGLIRDEIERVNRQLARVETVKQFRLIEQLLTPEDEELTPTMKLRRTFVNVKYKDLIDSMYERSEG